MLFTVPSKDSFKTLLLHNGNKVNSAPLVKEVNMTETHEYLQGLLQKYATKNTDWIHLLTKYL